MVLREIGSWGEKANSRVSSLQQREFDLGVDEAVYTYGSNDRFTVAEQYQVARQLRMIRESLKQNFNLSAEQMRRVEDRLDEAEDASRRLGRKDWILLFSGAVFSLILADIVTPDVAQHILIITTHGLGHLFGAGGGPVRGALDNK
jgi:hypothetical protein